jgi:hypothetical protein
LFAVLPGHYHAVVTLALHMGLRLGERRTQTWRDVNLAPHCTIPTLIALARHRDYRTTQRYVQVDGDHLRQTVERLVPEGEIPMEP